MRTHFSWVNRILLFYYIGKVQMYKKDTKKFSYSSDSSVNNLL
jgi:hypothetical protein